MIEHAGKNTRLFRERFRLSFAHMLPLAAVLIGCADRISSPADGNEGAVGAAVRHDDFRSVSHFDGKLSVAGPLKPGVPVPLIADIRSAFSGQDVSIEITAPELEVANRTPVGQPIRFTVGEKIPTTFTARDNFNGAENHIRTITLEFDRPGYYNVVMVVKGSGDSPAFDASGRMVLSMDVSSLWLLITPEGGVATSNFEPSLIPDEYLKSAGPFRTKADARRRPDQGDTFEGAPTHGPSLGANRAVSTITYEALYYHVIEHAYKPIPAAFYVVRNCTKEPEQIMCPEEQFENFDDGYTDSNAELTFACTGDDYEGEVLAVNYSIGIVNGALAPFAGSVSADCNGSFQTVMGNGGHVFVNLKKTYDGANTVFGEARGFLEITVISIGDSGYWRSTDEMDLNNDHIWENLPTKPDLDVHVMGHEYGHAFHNTTLGGYPATNCPDPHSVDVENTLLCTFVEGFAEFFAAAVRPDVVNYSWRNNIEGNDFFPGWTSEARTVQSSEGSVIEGAFAAFLFDLYDSGVEANDSIDGTGAYVTALMETCDVLSGGSWRAANGADELAYCAENAINPGSYFTLRGTPSSISESATEPGTWTAGRVNKAWKWNMYLKP